MHKHNWKVYSTALSNRCLLVECDCGKRGSVNDPTPEEWSEAFHAPSNPYKWEDNSRVTEDK